MIALLLLLALAFPAEAGNKLVVNGTTGQAQVVPMTAQEQAEADARDANPHVPIPAHTKVENQIKDDLALKVIVKALAKKFNLSEQQLIDAIKAELP